MKYIGARYIGNDDEIRIGGNINGVIKKGQIIAMSEFESKQRTDFEPVYETTTPTESKKQGVKL